MKFAYLILGEDFCSERDRAVIHNGDAQIIGVSTVKEACEEAIKLKWENIDCIELCGAFGAEGAMCVIDAVKNNVPVGYSVHLPVQNDVFRKVFGE